MLSEKGKFTRQIAGKHKVTIKFIEDHPKFHSIEVVQLYESKGKWQNVIRYDAIFRSLTILKIPLLCFHLTFPCSTLKFS